MFRKARKVFIGVLLMARDLHKKEQDPVHKALRQIVQQLLAGMEVKATTPRHLDPDGISVEEGHRLPVFHIAQFSRRYPDLRSVTSYIAPFLGADEKTPEHQRRVLAGHIATQGFAMLGNNYSAIKVVVDGRPESIIFKDHTQG
jgi:hypothetical protein